VGAHDLDRDRVGLGVEVARLIVSSVSELV
jgi:hypothetical protein